MFSKCFEIFLIEAIFDGIDDAIQGLVVYFSVMRYHVIIEFWYCTCSQALFNSSWHSFLSPKYRRVNIKHGCFIFNIFSRKVKFLITSHFFQCVDSAFCYLLCFCGAQIFSQQRLAQVITISKKKNAEPQSKEIIKCLHSNLYTMDPSFCFPVFILYKYQFQSSSKSL